MKLRIVILGLLFAVNIQIFTQTIPEPKTPSRLVNDFAGIFDISQRQDLEQMLRNYNDSTSTQIYVVTISDLEGYDISDYAVRLGEKWKIGQKGKDNGAVILIKPKIGNERGRVFIATGYGLEPVLTDARCGRIIDEYMIPYFSRDDYYSGTKAGIAAIIGYLSGQFSPDPKKDDNYSSVFLWILSIFIFIAIIVYAAKKGDDNNNNSSTGGGDSYPPVFPRGGYGGGRSGKGGFGGGFGGGGGGRFGGGGAGRGW